MSDFEGVCVRVVPRFRTPKSGSLRKIEYRWRDGVFQISGKGSLRYCKDPDAHPELWQQRDVMIEKDRGLIRDNIKVLCDWVAAHCADVQASADVNNVDAQTNRVIARQQVAVNDAVEDIQDNQRTEADRVITALQPQIQQQRLPNAGSLFLLLWAMGNDKLKTLFTAAGMVIPRQQFTYTNEDGKQITKSTNLAKKYLVEQLVNAVECERELNSVTLKAWIDCIQSGAPHEEWKPEPAFAHNKKKATPLEAGKSGAEADTSTAKCTATFKSGKRKGAQCGAELPCKRHKVDQQAIPTVEDVPSSASGDTTTPTSGASPLHSVSQLSMPTSTAEASEDGMQSSQSSPPPEIAPAATVPVAENASSEAPSFPLQGLIKPAQLHAYFLH